MGRRKEGYKDTFRAWTGPKSPKRWRGTTGNGAHRAAGRGCRGPRALVKRSFVALDRDLERSMREQFGFPVKRGEHTQ